MIGIRGDGIGIRGDGIGIRGDGIGTRGDGIPRTSARLADVWDPLWSQRGPPPSCPQAIENFWVRQLNLRKFAGPKGAHPPLVPRQLKFFG